MPPSMASAANYAWFDRSSMTILFLSYFQSLLTNRTIYPEAAGDGVRRHSSVVLPQQHDIPVPALLSTSAHESNFQSQCCRRWPAPPTMRGQPQQLDVPVPPFVLLLTKGIQFHTQAMACAANYAWVNRSSMTFLCRQAFAKLFKQSPNDLDMNIVYDVSHNIAKVGLESRQSRP